MNALVVSVEFTDILSLTLPYNRHHFDKVVVVTSPTDYWNLLPLTDANDAHLYGTDAFYRNGAKFNKWLALEEGLDRLGREGWIALVDADILWPKVVDLERYLRPGYLYCPYRHIAEPIPKEIPPESEWQTKYSMHRQLREFAGYSQVFHASDPVLGFPPWHQTDFTSAGTADSFFQAKWPEDRKIRPTFRVLHLGSPGANWCGRTTPYVGGGRHPDWKDRALTLRKMMLDRRTNRNFDHEKI